MKCTLQRWVRKPGAWIYCILRAEFIKLAFSVPSFVWSSSVLARVDKNKYYLYMQIFVAKQVILQVNK